MDPRIAAAIIGVFGNGGEKFVTWWIRKKFAYKEKKNGKAQQ